MLNHIVAINQTKNKDKFDLDFLDNYTKLGVEENIVKSLVSHNNILDLYVLNS